MKDEGPQRKQVVFVYLIPLRSVQIKTREFNKDSCRV